MYIESTRQKTIAAPQWKGTSPPSQAVASYFVETEPGVLETTTNRKAATHEVQADGQIVPLGTAAPPARMVRAGTVTILY